MPKVEKQKKNKNVLLFVLSFAQVGSSHSGYGKMKFDKSNAFTDFHVFLLFVLCCYCCFFFLFEKGVVSLTREYVTLEPFLDKAFGKREGKEKKTKLKSGICFFT